ncbi:MAG: B12-binding domain-containing radical SAM protein [Acidobacteriota bacterium]
MLVQKPSLLNVINLCKAYGKRIVVGGPYVTTSPEQLFYADHIFIGEAEATLPQFVHDLECGNAKRIYRATERPSLCSTPIPNFRLAKLKHYSAMSVQYSRGCPFQCEFCDIIEIFGRVPRTKSNEQILVELDELLRIGWRGMVFIVDDNFIGNKRNVKRLLPELIEWSERHYHPFSLITEASVNLAEDDELLEGMHRAGFRRVFLGIETPVEESLKEAHKGQNTRRNLLDSAKKIQSYGMEVMAGFIVGFDHDPEDIFERQISFIRESAIPLDMVGLLVGLLNALPDTQLWRRLKQEGRLIAESTGNNTDCSLNFIPKMETTRLIEGYRSILRTIYNHNEYYQRALNCLERISQTGSQPRNENFFANFTAFLSIVIALGIRDKARNEFWGYIHYAFTRHCEKFSHAVTLAAMGYHFRKVLESTYD